MDHYTSRFLARAERLVSYENLQAVHEMSKKEAIGEVVANLITEADNYFDTYTSLSYFSIFVDGESTMYGTFKLSEFDEAKSLIDTLFENNKTHLFELVVEHSEDVAYARGPECSECGTILDRDGTCFVCDVERVLDEY